MYEVEENNSAAYVQADFKGSNWSGNIGLRFVRTEEDIVIVSVAGSGPTDPDAILGSHSVRSSDHPSITRTRTGCRAQT